MKLIPFLAAAALCLLMASPALAAEQCKVASTGADGRPRFTDISLEGRGTLRGECRYALERAVISDRKRVGPEFGPCPGERFSVGRQ